MDDAVSVLEKCAGTVRLLITEAIGPGLLGHALAAHVVQTHCAMKTLFLSGYPIETIGLRGIDASFFLQKPLTPGRLARMARTILDTP